MRDVGERTEHVADAVACSVIDPRNRRCGKPGRLLTLQARSQLIRPRQRLREQPERMQRKTVAIGMRLDRAKRFHRVIDAAHSGREP